MQQSKTHTLLNDCFVHDKQRMRHSEALALLKSRLSTIAVAQTTPLENASGRILAQNIKSPRDIPSADNSAVDGYAFAYSDYVKNNALPILDRIAAGDYSGTTQITNSATRIFTGAPMPKGADTIAMQEDCTISNDDAIETVTIPTGLKQFSNCRKVGEDVAYGEVIAKKGNVLTPQLMAAIASTGLAKISVYSKLKIGLISNGNELLRPSGGQTEPFIGQVYDSNYFMLRAMLSLYPVEIIDYGVLEDDYVAIKNTISTATNQCDIVISSGGASKGEEDYIIPALEELGKRHLWQLAVKPGRPMSFGQVKQTPFFGLPGNPVACFICFALYVRQSIQLLAGANYKEPQRYIIASGFDIKQKKPDRREFLRGSIEVNSNGRQVLQKFNRDGSGLITGLRTSGGLIEIPEEMTRVKKGDLLAYIPFTELTL